MTAKSVKTVKPTQKKPKRRIVVSTGFEEFSGRLVPITMIVVGIMVILNCVAYFIQSDAIQYWFLFRNYLNLFGFLIVNSMLGPILISRIGIICLIAGGRIDSDIRRFILFPKRKGGIAENCYACRISHWSSIYDSIFYRVDTIGRYLRI